MLRFVALLMLIGPLCRQPAGSMVAAAVGVPVMDRGSKAAEAVGADSKDSAVGADNSTPISSDSGAPPPPPPVDPPPPKLRLPPSLDAAVGPAAPLFAPHTPLEQFAEPLILSPSLALRTGDIITLQSRKDSTFLQRKCCFPNRSNESEMIVAGTDAFAFARSRPLTASGYALTNSGALTPDSAETHFMVIVERDGKGGVFLMTQSKQFLQHSECCIANRTLPHDAATSRSSGGGGSRRRGVKVDSPLPDQIVHRFVMAAVARGTNVLGTDPPQPIPPIGSGLPRNPNAGPMYGSTPNGTAYVTIRVGSSRGELLAVECCYAEAAGSNVVVSADVDPLPRDTVTDMSGDGSTIIADSAAPDPIPKWSPLLSNAFPVAASPPTPFAGFPPPPPPPPSSLTRVGPEIPIGSPSSGSFGSAAANGVVGVDVSSVFIVRKLIGKIGVRESLEHFDFALAESVLQFRPLILGEQTLINISPTGQAIKFTIEHEVTTRQTFTFQQSFGVAVGTTFLTALPAIAPSGVVVTFTTQSAWTASRLDSTNTHFVAEFNARAEGRTNVTARGILDLGLASVPFVAEVTRFWETVLGEIVPFVYTVKGVFAGTFTWNMRYVIV